MEMVLAIGGLGSMMLMSLALQHLCAKREVCVRSSHSRPSVQSLDTRS